MKLRPSVCSTLTSLATLAALAIATPLHAQAIRVELSGGGATPTGPTNGNVNAGGTFGLGISHRLSGSQLSLGAEASLVIFGETQLVYEPCASPGCTAPMGQAGHLDLANYFVTARYQLGHGVIHPYIGVAGGLTQQWASKTYNGPLHAADLNGGGRASVGVESRLGRVGVALDVSYATVSTLEYEGSMVRYVPVTLRLSF